MRKLWDGLNTPITQVVLPTFKHYWFRPVDFHSHTYLVIHAQDTEHDAPVWTNATELWAVTMEARTSWAEYHAESDRNTRRQKSFDAFREGMLK
jgi:hypothetical protein